MFSIDRPTKFGIVGVLVVNWLVVIVLLMFGIFPKDDLSIDTQVMFGFLCTVVGFFFGYALGLPRGKGK